MYTTMQERFGHSFKKDGDKISGTIDQIFEVVNAIFETIGLQEVHAHKGEREVTETGEDHEEKTAEPSLHQSDGKDGSNPVKEQETRIKRKERSSNDPDRTEENTSVDNDNVASDFVFVESHGDSATGHILEKAKEGPTQSRRKDRNVPVADRDEQKGIKTHPGIAKLANQNGKQKEQESPHEKDSSPQAVLLKSRSPSSCKETQLRSDETRQGLLETDEDSSVDTATEEPVASVPTASDEFLQVHMAAFAYVKKITSQTLKRLKHSIM